MLRSVLPAATGMLLSGCTLLGIRSGETPSYTVVGTLGEAVELRHYPSRLAAETTVVSADSRTGRSDAFQLLFQYISGANRPAAKIAMTTPVETAKAEGAGQTIAMTTPVEARPEGGSTTMRFLLPSAFTAATAPEPTDPAVRIVTLPETTLAVLRFSGSTDPVEVEAHQTALLAAVTASGWQPAGAPFAMFYDPPWTLPFLRRNEVAVAVVQGGLG